MLCIMHKSHFLPALSGSLRQACQAPLKWWRHFITCHKKSFPFFSLNQPFFLSWNKAVSFIWKRLCVSYSRRGRTRSKLTKSQGRVTKTHRADLLHKHPSDAHWGVLFNRLIPWRTCQYPWAPCVSQPAAWHHPFGRSGTDSNQTVISRSVSAFLLTMLPPS